MSDKATDERLGEMQITLNALYRKLGDLERRLRRLENPQTMTGSIATDDPRIFLKREGFAWFYRLSPYKEWIGPFDSEAEATAAMHLTSNRAVMTGSIEGLDGEWMVTARPDILDADGRLLDPTKVYHLVEVP